MQYIPLNNCVSIIGFISSALSIRILASLQLLRLIRADAFPTITSESVGHCMTVVNN